MRVRVLVLGFFVLSGCVSRRLYIQQGEALARSLELNRACIASVEALEAKNKAFNEVYGDSLRLRKEAEAGKLK
jgi:hypothetical protein